MRRALDDLRDRVVRRSLFPPVPLAAAVERLGFVQMDPIRAPARAQDLILRHRALDYRAGDVERRFGELGVDEDALYAYGLVTPRVRRLLHPRAGARPTAPAPGTVDAAVLAYLRDATRAGAPVHPRALAAHFGAGAERNAWGGQSLATTRALERLHHHGMVRVAGRERGVRLYAAAESGAAESGAPEARTDAPRADALVRLLLDIFAPLPEASLRRLMSFVRHAVPAAEGRAAVARLLRTGALAHGEVGGVRYVWPADGPGGDDAPAADDVSVRFLAPFDPVVWDRARFAHLWGWEYRFEAYTPAARRVRGYYALPLLWRGRVVGWANVTAAPGARGAAGLDVDVGFAERRPRERGFARALDAEVASLARFLAPR